MSKSQHQSTESLKIRLPPFIDKTTGDYITGGSDVVTLTIERPDATVLPGGPHHPTYDSTVDMWIFTITTGSYQQGEWRVKAVSNNANAIPQWRYYQWGDYVDDITTTKTRVGTPTGASVSADIASVQTKLGTPAGVSVSTDIADVKSDTSLLPAAMPKIDVLHKIGIGRWKIQGTQLLIYDSNGTTVLLAFNLKDDIGQPSSTRVFERTPA